MDILSGDEFFTLLRVTLNAVQRKGYISGAYCQDADMRNFGGETRDDKTPVEEADGEATRLTEAMWRALYERESAHKEETMPTPDQGGPLDI